MGKLEIVIYDTLLMNIGANYIKVSLYENIIY